MRFRIILLGIAMFSLLSSSVAGNADFSSFHTPTIKPGESGKLTFTVENNYDAAMENVYLTVEIYKYVTEEESKNINEISSPPVFENNAQKIIRYNECINAGDSLQISLQISASKGTAQGTYLVRMKIEFKLDNIPYMMESIGYFSDEELMNYQLNETHLPSGCSGIIPETSFTVREPIPLWPLYVLIGATVFFGALATVFYMQDTGKLPQTKKIKRT
ncbi:MAG: hypothetical protein QMC80_07745 [Thermoplasmatales archaeon]|nr:hypothetical protein [Thermoplasmatales archaeon]